MVMNFWLEMGGAMYKLSGIKKVTVDGDRECDVMIESDEGDAIALTAEKTTQRDE